MKTQAAPIRRRRASAGRLCALLLAVLLCLTACSEQEAQGLSVSGFGQDDSAFCYPQTEWDMTPAALQEQLDCTLAAQPDGSGEPEEPLDGYTGALFLPETVSLGGKDARASFQFDNGALWAAGLTVSDGSTQELFDDLLKQARDAFGSETQSREKEPASAEGLSDTLTTSSYLWERGEGEELTRLTLSAIYQSDAMISVSLDVSHGSVS